MRECFPGMCKMSLVIVDSCDLRDVTLVINYSCLDRKIIFSIGLVHGKRKTYATENKVNIKKLE